MLELGAFSAELVRVERAIAFCLPDPFSGGPDDFGDYDYQPGEDEPPF